MKVIIAGSRDITDYGLLLQAIQESGFEITHVISGGARGVDTLAEKYAKEHEIPITIYYAQWNKFAAIGQTKRAGHERNKVMAENGEALVALWDGHSAGTGNMVDNARTRGLKIYVKTVQVKKESMLTKLELREPNFRRNRNDVQNKQS